jgi:hypothetical protein
VDRDDDDQLSFGSVEPTFVNQIHLKSKMPGLQITPIQAVKKVWEKIAPLQLADRSWDNVGVMIGELSSYISCAGTDGQNRPLPIQHISRSCLLSSEYTMHWTCVNILMRQPHNSSLQRSLKFTPMLSHHLLSPSSKPTLSSGRRS